MKSIFIGEIVEKTKKIYPATGEVTVNSKKIGEEVIYECDLNYILKKDELFFIKSLNKTVKIENVIRSEEEEIIYKIPSYIIESREIKFQSSSFYNRVMKFLLD
jgi:hypothetical protein